MFDGITIFWFFMAAVLAVIPIPLIKFYIDGRDTKWIWLAVLSYLALIYTYIKILGDRNIAVLYPMLKVLSVFIVVFVGWALYDYKLDSKAILGIFLGVVSIYLLSSGG